MSALTAPLREAPLDAVAWAEAYIGTATSMIGSAKLSLPDDPDERLALEYKLLLAVDDGTVDVDTLILQGFGTSRYDDTVRTFNEEFFRPFAREVGYRLSDLASDVQGDARVPVDRLLVVFNAGGTVSIDERDQRGAQVTTSHTNVTGNMNSNVAVGGSTISDSPITASWPSDLAHALRTLADAEPGLEPERRAAVQAAAETLAAAVEQPAGTAATASAATLVGAAETIAKASPTMRERLGRVAEGAVSRLAASGVVKAIQFAIEHAGHFTP